MFLLTATNQKVQLVTDAIADVEAYGSYVDNASGTITAGGSGTLASITSATTTDIIGVPGASTQRNVTSLGARNNHASTSVNVTWNYIDGTSTVTMMKVNLLPGEAIIMDENGNWTHYDSNGGPYPAIGNAAVQANMEAATSLTLFVPPGMVKHHPGVNKFWGLFDAAGATTAGYNVDAPTDNGTGDITVNITTDFSSASWCASVTVEMTATTYAVANARTGHVRSGGQAAGTCRCDCIDGTATTQLVKDPTKWHISGWGDQA